MNELYIDNWDEFFFRHVYLVASKSKDKSTQIGAILVRDGVLISEGYNGICRKVQDNVKERNERPEKYHWYEHGERNSIFNAARNGIKILGCIMYTQYPHCTDCARATIQSGIVEVVFHKQWCNIWEKIKQGKWVGHDDRTLTMFKESGIKVRYFDKFLGIKTMISEQVCEV